MINKGEFYKVGRLVQSHSWGLGRISGHWHDGFIVEFSRSNGDNVTHMYRFSESNQLEFYNDTEDGFLVWDNNTDQGRDTKNQPFYHILHTKHCQHCGKQMRFLTQWNHSNLYNTYDCIGVYTSVSAVFGRWEEGLNTNCYLIRDRKLDSIYPKSVRCDNCNRLHYTKTFDKIEVKRD